MSNHMTGKVRDGITQTSTVKLLEFGDTHAGIKVNSI